MKEYQTYPENKAVEVWKDESGVQYSVVRCEHSDISLRYDLRGGHYCGYCRFVERPLVEPGDKGIATYVPVHWGITWAQGDEDGMVYGFDCNHHGDSENPQVEDIEWVKAECERMARGILLAAEYEEEYLTSEGDARGEVLDRYIAQCREENMDLKFNENFGVMINLLAGEL